MSAENTDFLRFNAYSIKDLITRKLSEDGNFTDQIYDGSNLAVLIDIVSYMFQCFMYNLNNAASESMFSDTQIYENMNRLCKLIGYSPRGFTPASVTAYIQSNDDSLNGTQIQKYSYVDTGLTDSNGKKICFSVPKKDDGTTETINNETYHRITLYNGMWKLYGTIFTASGTDYETFVLADVKSDSDDKKYVAGNFIDVYVESEDGTITPWYYDRFDIFHVTGSTNFQDDGANSKPQFSKLYDEDDKVYSVRINEEHQYEVKFGNGTSGKRLTKGDRVYVFYLDTNGLDGKVDTSEIGDELKFEGGADQFGISKNLYNKIVFGNNTDVIDSIVQHDDYSIILDNSVTTPVAEEDVEEIRQNAPECFKTGNRLITKNDYEYFFRNMVDQGVVDVKCMNNWEYMSTFFSWLYRLGKENHGDASYYLNETRFTEYFGNSANALTDAADQNNVYLWIKTENENSNIKSSVEQNSGIKNIKILTTQTQYLKPINVCFDICAAPVEIAKKYLEDNSGNFGVDEDGQYESYIEITMSDDKVYVNNSIENGVIAKIRDFFNINKCKLGQVIDFSELTNEIYKINGVQNIRTVYDPHVTQNTVGGMSYGSRAYDGVSFASWSNGLIDIGDDMNVSNTTRTLEKFQFPVLFNSGSLENKIKIIKRQLNNTNYIKF